MNRQYSSYDDDDDDYEYEEQAAYDAAYHYHDPATGKHYNSPRPSRSLTNLKRVAKSASASVVSTSTSNLSKISNNMPHSLADLRTVAGDLKASVKDVAQHPKDHMPHPPHIPSIHVGPSPSEHRSRYLPGLLYVPMLVVRWLLHPFRLLLGNSDDDYGDGDGYVGGDGNGGGGGVIHHHQHHDHHRQHGSGQQD